MFKVFGLEFGKEKQANEEERKLQSIVPRSDQGAVVIDDNYVGRSAEFFIYGNTAEFTFRSQKDRIELYRRMCENPYVDTAIDDIVNEAITFDVEKGIVFLKLDKTTFSESIKKKIIDEFNGVLELMEFDFNGPDVFRQWYVDGQTYIHVVVDPEDLKSGIHEIRFVDPRAIQKIVEIQTDPATGVEVSRNEFYLYMPNMALDKNNLSTKTKMAQEFKAVKLTADSVAYIWSGRTNIDGFPISYMDRAIKAWNQINSLEDAFIVFHLSRAPSKRAFYIDVGDLPKPAAEKYMKGMIEKYKNKAIYDMKTGQVDNAAQINSMFHDYWLPRQNGKNSTEIGVIEGTAQNFAGPNELEYWLKKLWRAFKIPITRLNSESVTPFGRGSEITRDELKFQKFINKLRGRFSQLFSEILRRQLLLKNIITQDDWEENKYNVRFEYAQDSMFFEMKSTEILEMRLQTLNTITPYIGKYYTQDWVEKNVLMLSDEQIDEMHNKLGEEIGSGIHDSDFTDKEGNPMQPSQAAKKGLGAGAAFGQSTNATSTDANKNSAYSSPKSKSNPGKSLISTRDKAPKGA